MAPKFPRDTCELDGSRWMNMLANMPVFDGVAPETFELLCEDLLFERFAEGGRIFQADAKTDRMYFLLEGVVRSSQVDERGLSYTAKLFCAPSHFGELAALGGLSTYQSVLEAQSAVVTASVPIATLERCIEQDHHLCRAWLFSTARQHAVTIEFARQHVLGGLSEQLASALMSLSEVFGRSSGARKVIDLPLSYSKLANHVGSQRRSVIKSIKALINGREAELTSDGWVVDEEKLVQRLQPNRLSLTHSILDNRSSSDD